MNVLNFEHINRQGKIIYHDHIGQWRAANMYIQSHNGNTWPIRGSCILNINTVTELDVIVPLKLRELGHREMKLTGSRILFATS